MEGFSALKCTAISELFYVIISLQKGVSHVYTLRLG